MNFIQKRRLAGLIKKHRKNNDNYEKQVMYYQILLTGEYFKNEEERNKILNLIIPKPIAKPH